MLLSHRLRTIVSNSGGEGSVVVAKVEESAKNFGYDAKEGKYVDMLKEGIIDPTKVTRIALENAASVAGMILTTECALSRHQRGNPSPCRWNASNGWRNAWNDVKAYLT